MPPPLRRRQDRADATGGHAGLSASGQWQILSRLIPYLWPAGRRDLNTRVVIAMGLLVAAKGITVATPFFYKQAVDALDSPDLKGVALPAMFLLSYGLARLFQVLTAQIRDFIFMPVTQHGLRALSRQTFAHLHRLSMSFHLSRRTGALSRAIERGNRAIEFILRFILFNILPTILELLLVAGVFLIHFGAGYMTGLLAAVVVYVAFSVVITDWRVKFRRAMNDEDSRAGSRAVDSLLNFETVRHFGNEGLEIERYDTALSGYQDAALKSQGSLTLLNMGQAAIINITLIGVMIASAAAYIAGDLTLGDVVLANSLLIQLFVPLNLLGFVYREVRQALVDMEYLFGLLDTDAEVIDPPDAAPLRVERGEIRFEHVGFAYDARRSVLEDLDFTVPAGGSVALVGPTGAGKSTLSRLLFRFYDVDAGRILIDGQDIRDVSQDSLREAIGIVPQDTVLFNDSIAYNIGYGRPDAGMDEIVAAARMAQIHDFAQSLPDGYDTRVGERGLKLSGGEKQRVAIARTILKNPPILILDEATSALDTATEKAIEAALAEVARNRTTLMIAHRLSTVVGADMILVMQAGSIVERGSHADLLAKDGLYAEMWARQQAGQGAEGNSL